MAPSLSLLALLSMAPIAAVHGHGQLVRPAPRADSVGRAVSYMQREPVFTSAGPAGTYSNNAFRCHDYTKPTALTTLTAGQSFDVEWTFSANHPGDCYLYMSYDDDKASPQNWIKVASFVGCGDLQAGGVTPAKRNVRSVTLPADLPACDHCVMRWEWYALQQVYSIEYYVQCTDVRIVSNKQGKPTKTVAINGLSHLPAAASEYRKAYANQIGEQYLLGPPVWTSDSGTVPTVPPKPVDPVTPPPTLPPSPPTGGGNPPPENGDCKLSGELNVGSQWGTGFVGSVRLTANEAVQDGWDVMVNFANGEQITSAWNCAVDGNDAATGALRLSSSSYNSVITQGQTVTCGFQGSKQAGNAFAGASLWIEGCGSASVDMSATQTLSGGNVGLVDLGTCSGNGRKVKLAGGCHEKCSCNTGYYGAACQTDSPVQTWRIEMSQTMAKADEKEQVEFTDCEMQLNYKETVEIAAMKANPGSKFDVVVEEVNGDSIVFLVYPGIKVEALGVSSVPMGLKVSEKEVSPGNSDEIPAGGASIVPIVAGVVAGVAALVVGLVVVRRRNSSDQQLRMSAKGGVVTEMPPHMMQAQL